MKWIALDAYKSWTHLVNYVENVLENFGEKGYPLKAGQLSVGHVR